VNTTPKKRVVIIGGGFGGLNAAKKLGGRRDFDVTLIDRYNHYTFQPLLYQVATAALSEQEIADPLRGLLAKHSNVRVLQATATHIDKQQRCVHTTHGVHPYDYLLVAAGVQNSYFGHEEWEEAAPGLKTLSQAAEIRTRILSAFEAAAHETTPEASKRHLTFVVIGGGATGVEMAGAIAEITRQTISQELRGFDPNSARIVLVEAAPRLLSAFLPKDSERARRDLMSLGVEVRLNTKVLSVGANMVELEDERIQAGVIVWAAGVRGAPLVKSLGVELDRRGCVPVAPDCTIAGHPEVFVIGDVAVCLHHKTGKPLGQVANVAAQQGRYFARTIMGDLKGKPRKPFKYFNKGQMATIGVFRAVCEMGNFGFAGFPAWVVWIAIHIYYLSSMHNRSFVFLRWVTSLITMTRHARVIVPPEWETYREEETPRAQRAIRG
jgi:NADH:ubiquinone reductase (H+-translocating)